MNRKETKTQEEILSSIINLVNQMRTASDSLFKHTYDIDAPLPPLNKGVLAAIEKLLSNSKNEVKVSEELSNYVNSNEASVEALLEYLKSKETSKKDLKLRSKGKSKYFKMVLDGIKRAPRKN